MRFRAAALVLLVSCFGAAQTPKSSRISDALVDRVDTTAFIQLEVQSFKDLTSKQKQLAYWLEQASIAKLDRICRKLRLSPADHVLEIGTGWGGFAAYAASQYGCQVTTATISRQQFEYAAGWFAGLLDLGPSSDSQAVGTERHHVADDVLVLEEAQRAKQVVRDFDGDRLPVPH